MCHKDRKEGSAGLVSFLTDLMWGTLLGLALEGILWVYRRICGTGILPV